MAFNYTNNAETDLVSGITNTDTAITVVSAIGFPTSFPFRAKLNDGAAAEFIVVTAGPPLTTWTVVRGQENSTATPHSAGTLVSNPITVGVFDDLFEHMVDFGPRASLPSPGTVGRLYVADDPGWYLFREDGVSWNAWGPLFSIIEAVDIPFSWINPMSSNAVGFNWVFDGGVFLQAPPLSVGSEQIRVRYRNTSQDAPVTTPYQVTVAFQPLLDDVNNTSCGIVFGEASSGKLIFFRLIYDSITLTKTDLALSLDKYNSFSSFNSTYIRKSASTLTKLVWLRMKDDGTNLTWSFSVDKENFLDFYSVARNNFFTTAPDQIGYAVNTNNTTGYAGMLLLSWKKETP